MTETHTMMDLYALRSGGDGASGLRWTRALWAVVSVVFWMGVVAGSDAVALEESAGSEAGGGGSWPLIVTQVPVEGTETGAHTGRSRLVLVESDGSSRRLAESFFAAEDADISFDGKRVLFAGRATVDDSWSVWEVGVDGADLRRVVAFSGDARSPRYLSTLYTIVSTEPWYTILFVGSPSEGGGSELYASKLDGSGLTQLTYTLASVADPYLMPDGRVVFSVWQQALPGEGGEAYRALFGVNIDGADYAAFTGRQGRRLRRMPCLTSDGLIVFVESDRVERDGAGSLGSARLRRPLHSYRALTSSAQGRFHGPSPLPDGSILVSHRVAGEDTSFGVIRFDPETRGTRLLFDDPAYHDLFARTVGPRPEPDGRSSVVRPSDPHGELYCLNVYTSDEPALAGMATGSVRRVRLVEGVIVAESVDGPFPVVTKRLLGEAPVAPDGSFAVKLPANTPVELQLLDESGAALRSCRWIWARNREPRGCIGCHEDGELTPENRFVDAMHEHSVLLDPPPANRRTIGFRSDVLPIFEEACRACHGTGGEPPRLFEADGKAEDQGRGVYAVLVEGEGGFVTPGQARTSPLAWHLQGRNLSRPWDGGDAEGRPVLPMGPGTGRPLTEQEIQTVVEWIDTGAAF